MSVAAVASTSTTGSLAWAWSTPVYSSLSTHTWLSVLKCPGGLEAGRRAQASAPVGGGPHRLPPSNSCRWLWSLLQRDRLGPAPTGGLREAGLGGATLLPAQV